MSERLIEDMLAARFGRRHALLTGNGTTALHIALEYAKARYGCQSAIYPEMTCQTAVNAAVFAGLACHFIDIGPDGFLANPAYWQHSGHDLREQCCVLTDLFGYLHSASELRGLESFGYVIEDAAQAFYSVNEGVHAGAIGSASILSFGPGKHLDVGGGGALLTDDVALLDFGMEFLASLAARQQSAASLRKDHYRQLLELEKQQLARAEHVLAWHAIYRRNSQLFLSGFDGLLLEPLRDALDRAEVTHQILLERQQAAMKLLRELPVAIIPYSGASIGWRLTFTLDSSASRNRLKAWLDAAGIPVSTLFPPASSLNTRLMAGHVAINLHSRLINIDLSKLDLKQLGKAMTSYDWNETGS